MRCPDCNNILNQTELTGQDKSFRCDSCGGVWIEALVINQMAEGKQLRIEGKQTEVVAEKKEPRLCPADGNRLSSEEGENFPSEVRLWKCHKCNHWWLPGNGIFNLKQAYEVRTEYRKLWDRGGKFSHLTLPVVLTILLVFGLGAVVMLVRNNQQLDTQAASPVLGRIVVMYLGDNRVQMRFRAARDVEAAYYKRDSDELWQEALILTEGDWKVIVVSGVNPGEKIWLSIQGKVWKLTVGQKQ